MPAIALVLRAVLGTLYLVSGWTKLLSAPGKFASTIAQYDVVSGPLASLAAYAVPWAEYLCGICLILGLRTAGALRILWALNTAFIVLLSQALLRNLAIRDCGCFGERVLLSPEQTLVLDLVTWIVFLFLHLKLPSTRRYTLDTYLDR
ncbi:MAG: hypothetical protein MOGMAGMI_00050 [Candidatus Omnitrophica bacterium]|nr:hypothetical protein [Candidatus Omnitrophota bacterium]